MYLLDYSSKAMAYKVTVEKKDRKSNSRYAKEFNVALPIELSVDEQKKITDKICARKFCGSSYGGRCRNSP